MSMTRRMTIIIDFEEEYDDDMFYNFINWHKDRSNWADPDCIHIEDYEVKEVEDL